MSILPQFRKKHILSIALTCLTACGCTLVLLGIVYALRGIWPFGTDNVAYVDAAQFYVPDYYQTWDALHGASLHLNWFAGLAEGGNASWISFIRPANWVFLFVARDHVLEALSLYLAVKLVIVTLAVSLVLCLRFPRVSARWKVLFSLLYTFSGFTLQYYSNFTWFSVVAMFPLLLYAVERLLRSGKYILYVLIYVWFLWFSVYFSYMVTVYILLFSFGYFTFLLPKDQRGDRIFRLGMSTLAAYGLSAYYWLRSSSSLAGTSRFQSNLDSGLMAGMTTWNLQNTRHTVLMLLGTALAVALLLTAVRRQRTLPAELRARRARVIRFFLYMLAVFAIPMVFTNIDTAWHFGQYNFFPMRYGYMLPATLIAGACLTLEESEPAYAPALASGQKRWLPWIVISLCAIGIAHCAPWLIAVTKKYGAVFLTSLGKDGFFRYFATYFVCGALFVILYYTLLCLRRRWTVWAVAAVVLLQIGANLYGNIAPDDGHTYTKEYDPSYIEAADSLYDFLSRQDVSPLSRAKNVDNSLNAGYPAIAGISALSSVNSSNSATRLGVFRELGYTVNYFRVLDTGGTVFSDMLLGVDYILSARPLDESLYAPGLTVDGIQIGTALYPGVVGLMYDETALDDYLDYETLPDRLNALYHAFTDSQADLAAAVTPEISITGSGLRTYTLTCELDSPSFLYLASNGMMMNITAGGRAVAVPSYLNLENKVYPGTFNSNLLYMGLFGAGTVEIQFSSATNTSAEDLTVVALDKGLLDSFYADANLDPDAVIDHTDDGMTVTVTADSEGLRLFLPISYSSRWRCTVNGQTVTPQRVMGVLMSIPLEAGKNTVSLVRGPSRISVGRGLICSIACLVLAIAWLILRRACPRIRTAVLPKWVYMAAQWIFLAVVAAAICFIYIAPTVLLITRGTIVWF